MRMVTKVAALFIIALACVTAGFGTASAAAYTITWLDMSPTPFGGSVPNGSVFLLPGVGPVTVTYAVPSPYTHSRTNNVCLQNGSLAFGPDTYSWAAHELFATIFTVGPDPLVPLPWSITYTFSGTVPSGELYVGVAGLGATTSFGGGASTAQVSQNGSFFGDWTGGCGPWGPTQFTGGVGTFSMRNSLTGAGGADPWWNTPLGVVRINDAVNSITVNFSQLRGDGVGVNLGHSNSHATPAAPTSWGRIKTLYR